MSLNYDLGSNVVKEDLATLPKKMLDFAFEVLLQQAELMKGLAQVYVLVDTGSLRDSIRVERGGEGESWRRVRVRAGGYVTNPKSGRIVDYAAIIELKSPYMRPAFDQVQPTIAEMIKTKIVERCQP